MTNKLEIIGRIEIPPAVREHRFYAEAKANGLLMQSQRDPLKQVVGTWNTREVELYAWAANVLPHRDNIGWMYAVLLDEGISFVHARPRRLASSGPHLSMAIQAGDVFRLDDFCEHWTEDSGPRVAAFIGCFDEPCDLEAMRKLQTGIDRLVAGAYYDTPRVRQGFRIMHADEAYVANEEHSDAEMMLLADVPPHRQEAIVRCAKCDERACRLDQHWPYHWEMNVCLEHLHQRVELARRNGEGSVA